MNESSVTVLTSSERAASAKERLLAAIEENAPAAHIVRFYVLYIYELFGRSKVTASEILKINRRTLQRWNVDDENMKVPARLTPLPDNLSLPSRRHPR